MDWKDVGIRAAKTAAQAALAILTADALFGSFSADLLQKAALAGLAAAYAVVWNAALGWAKS
jgi:hypothetical protein